jgi:hypothetical protein
MTKQIVDALKGMAAGTVSALVTAALARLRASRLPPESRRAARLLPAASPGYGGVTGALYSAVDERLDGLSLPLKGLLYGTALWALGRIGWFPAPGMAAPRPHEASRRRLASWTADAAYSLALVFAYKALQNALPWQAGYRDEAERPTTAPERQLARAGAREG